MRVGRDRIVSIDYIIRLVGGEVVESTTGGGPLAYLHGRAQIVPGVERAVEGRDEGEEIDVELRPAEAWGDRDPDGVFAVPRAAFAGEEPVEPGMTFSGMRPDGDRILFSILRAGAEQVLVDTNHPLAGKIVRVWIAIRAVRPATEEEIADGRAMTRLSLAPPPA